MWIYGDMRERMGKGVELPGCRIMKGFRFSIHGSPKGLSRLHQYAHRVRHYCIMRVDSEF